VASKTGRITTRKKKLNVYLFRRNTIWTVNSISEKLVSFALVQCFDAAYLCSQKLIDVQQTLIANPNPLKNTSSFNPGKTNKSDISQLLFFEFRSF
jgi:hypothetical protein